MRQYQDQQLSGLNKLARGFWLCVYWVLFRFSPVPLHTWRASLLRLFGASVGKKVRIYPSARIWAPWNLTMADESCIGPGVDCYCVDRVELGPRSVVSQRAFLCTAGHDYNRQGLPLITAPIVLYADAWVTAEVYVGPGVVLHEGAVALARSVVVRDVEAWCVVAGNPAKPVKRRARLGGEA